ncbi:hypothetical protein PENSPDRAFT_748850 [Peniophora sp. CONT]|nr:hypothetical protein PENSPDRAFT_748850 [Peniophora sp. CONT]
MDGSASTVGSIDIEGLALDSPSVSTARRAIELRVPLLRLPQELLRMIMHLTIPHPIRRRPAPYEEVRYGDHPKRGIIPWLYLGHICSNLRDTLMAMHQLWAEVACSFDRLDITRELVRRASGAPLTITMLHNSIPDDLIEFLLPYFHNARHIQIRSPRALAKMMDTFGALDLPLVEELVFDNSRAWGPVDQIREALALRSLDGLDAGVAMPILAPCLKSLHLSYIAMPFAASLHLRELSLRIPWRKAPAFTGHLLDTLLLCPNLRTLNISGMNFAPEATNASPIPLPHLRNLSMQGSYEPLSMLWSRITVPFDTQVRAEIDADLEIDPAVWETLSAFAHHVLHSRHARPISGFAFFLHPTQYYLGIRIFTAADNPLVETEQHRLSSLRRGHYCILDVEVTCGIEIIDVHGHLTRMRDMFGLAEVENLDIGALERYDEDEEPAVCYAMWLSAFRNVRNLCLSYYPFCPRSWQGIEPEYELLYPHLRSMTLVNLLLDEDELNSVTDMIERRTAHGIPLAELRIAFDDTEYDKKAHEMGDDPAVREFRTTLRNRVPSVEFDGEYS